MYYGIPSGVLPYVRFSLTPISRDAIILYSVDWDFSETWHMTEHCWKKSFQGQRWKVKVIASRNALLRWRHTFRLCDIEAHLVCALFSRWLITQQRKSPKETMKLTKGPQVRSYVSEWIIVFSTSRLDGMTRLRSVCVHRLQFHQYSLNPVYNTPCGTGYNTRAHQLSRLCGVR